MLRAALLLLLAAPGCLHFHDGPLTGPLKTVRFLQLEDLRVRVEDSGPGAAGGTVMLVHGFGAALDEYFLVSPALIAAGYRVVAIDLKGHGLTDRHAGDYSIEAQAELVRAAADQLGLERFLLVGHSWGSAVALRLAQLHPARVERLALFNGMFFDEQLPLMFSWARLPLVGELLFAAFYRERFDEKMAFAFYDPEPYITEQYLDNQDWVLDQPGTLAAALATVRAMDFAALQASLGGVSQPVLLLWGREDRVTPLAWGERMLGLLPNARLEVLPRCGHLPMVEAVRPATRALLAFLAEARP